MERGLAGSRERAQALILAGRVLVEEQKVEKPGTAVAEDAALRVLGDDLRYVSRGGLKLERALEYWGIDVAGRACVDVGASTGGFTDCMLQHGAASVLAVDTGYGQIAHKLRVDRAGEVDGAVQCAAAGGGGTAAGKGTGIGGDDASSFLAMDVSFHLGDAGAAGGAGGAGGAGEKWQGEAVVLVKPQFEAGREHVGKGGIVRGAGGAGDCDRAGAGVRGGAGWERGWR